MWYLKVWLFPTFARDSPCVTGEVGEQTKECHDSNLGANLSITTLPLLPLDKTQQKLRDVTHIGHYTCMCASVAIDMCGLSNPILCCLFLLQVNYIYMCILKKNKAHTSPHRHRTTVKLWGTHHSVAQWDECERVVHTEKISETMTPQSEPHNFVLCFF